MQLSRNDHSLQVGHWDAFCGHFLHRFWKKLLKNGLHLHLVMKTNFDVSSLSSPRQNGVALTIIMKKGCPTGIFSSNAISEVKEQWRFHCFLNQMSMIGNMLLSTFHVHKETNSLADDLAKSGMSPSLYASRTVPCFSCVITAISHDGGHLVYPLWPLYSLTSLNLLYAS